MVTFVAIVAAVLTIFRQKRLLGFREAAEGQEKRDAAAGDADNKDEMFTGRWPTNQADRGELILSMIAIDRPIFAWFGLGAFSE